MLHTIPYIPYIHMGLCLPWRGQSQRQRNGIGDELGGHRSCFHKILVIQMESYVTPRQDHFMASGDSDDPCCVYVEKLFISLWFGVSRKSAVIKEHNLLALLLEHCITHIRRCARRSQPKPALSHALTGSNILSGVCMYSCFFHRIPPFSWAPYACCGPASSTVFSLFPSLCMG